MNINKWENRDFLQYDTLINELHVLSGINQQLINDVLSFFEIYVQNKLQTGKSIKLKNGTYIQQQQIYKSNKINKFVQFKSRTPLDQCFTEKMNKELKENIERYIQKRVKK